jgi:sensor histidine kinase YesM
VFEATNSVPASNGIADSVVDGVGLSNIKRRLELIYPKRHELVIQKENGQFYVRLVIWGNGSEIPVSNV